MTLVNRKAVREAMRLIMMGPPGSGKGTQAKFVAERFGVPAISTGDIFRVNLSRGTPLGVEARRYMDAGDYVPDETTNLMLRNRIEESDAAPFNACFGVPMSRAGLMTARMLSGAVWRHTPSRPSR